MTDTALFTWKQEGPRSGQMTASLNTGQVCVGLFFQITSETQVDELEPLWLGWRRPWRGWDHWGPDTAFITHYSGTVVANLSGPDGHMRCRFQLTRPTAGMAGGGAGRCQLPNGTTIGATFPPVGWPGQQFSDPALSHAGYAPRLRLTPVSAALRWGEY